MWNTIVEKITPYIVKVETPNGHGTGFLCLYNDTRVFCGIATAWHVVSHADQWQQPIRVHHFPSNTSVFLKETDRIVFRDTQTDSAVIVFHTGTLTLPEDLIPLLPTDVPLAIGTDVGWLGFPALAPWELCFFSGIISAREEWRHAYLIDGVAINGVSGGPVVYSTETEGVQIVGTISAYVSNTATGDTLPGLSIARDVSHFHDTISQFKSLDEASKQKEIQAQAQKTEKATRTVETPADRAGMLEAQDQKAQEPTPQPSLVAVPEPAAATTQPTDQAGEDSASKSVVPIRRAGTRRKSPSSRKSP